MMRHNAIGYIQCMFMWSTFVQIATPQKFIVNKGTVKKATEEGLSRTGAAE